MLNNVANASKEVSISAMKNLTKKSTNQNPVKTINPVIGKLVKPLDGGISSIGKESDLGQYLHIIG